MRDALKHLWGQLRRFGKPLPKNGLCEHLKKVELFTYLGATPKEYCPVHDKYFTFDFINNYWFVIPEKE